ncbi:MAG TPA: arginine deiminase family protein [Chitinophagaceae bacterium]|nr:arginine deiminase family protein [Chitinophagaceae bacterium]
MLSLHINDETAQLKAVVLGRADGQGEPPRIADAYDPKSMENLKFGTYPKQKDMIEEMEAVKKILERYGVKVYQPEFIPKCNQIFARDIGFVIEDKFIKANILPERERELTALHKSLDKIPDENIIQFPEEVHVEGGDVMPCGDYIFVGVYRGGDYSDMISARTNRYAIKALQTLFPHKKVKSFNLRKSNTNPRKNALHLDCCFQPVGNNNAIIHRDSFLENEELEWLIDLYGEDRLFEVTEEEMYHMNCNIFSISPDVVLSGEKFTRLNGWLQKNGITVEAVPYAEIAKQSGLLRCSTLPLIRE